MKKFIAMLLSICIVCNLINVPNIRAEVVNHEVDEDFNDDEFIDIDEVYVDGIGYEISYNLDTGDIFIAGEDDSSDSKAELIMYSDDSVADASIINNGVEEDYQIDINELNEEAVDVKILKDDEIIASYDEPEDIVDDIYNGQVSLTFEIVFVATVLVMVVYASNVIVHNGKHHVSAKSFYKSITNAAKKVKEEAKEWYYPAYVDINSHKTWILPTKINKDKAATLIKANLDVYSFTSSMAKKAITAAGYTPYSSKETGEYHTKNISKRYVFRHWHKGTKVDGKVTRCRNNCHSLYGVPIYVE